MRSWLQVGLRPFVNFANARRRIDNNGRPLTPIRDAQGRFATKPFAEPMGRSRGIILVAVLWFIAAFSALILTFSASVRQHLQLSANELAADRAQMRAETGVAMAIEGLMGATADDDESSLKLWPLNGRARIVDVKGSRLRVRVRDAAARLNVNLADAAALAGLIASAVDQEQAARRIAARIIDWRDADDDPGAGGAEAAQYKRAGRTSGPGNRPFLDVTELRHVLGWTQRMARSLGPLMTVYGSDARINAVQASAAMLARVPGVNTTNLNRMLALRSKPDQLRRFIGSQSRLAEYLKIKPGPVFEITVVVLDKSLVPLTLEATVWVPPSASSDQTENKVRVLNWRWLWQDVAES